MKKYFVILFIYLFVNSSVLLANIIVVGGLTHAKKSNSGENYTGLIAIQNPENKAQEVKVYQHDYFFKASGEVYYNDPATQERSNAAWIVFSPKRLIIPAKEIATVHYTVSVPPVKMIGTYWSMILVENIPEDSVESENSDPVEVAIGIRQSFRYGIQMVTHIGHNALKKIKFINSRLVKENDFIFLHLDIQNTGELWLRTSISAEIYTIDGRPAGKFDGGKFRIYPETSIRSSIDISTLTENTYRALVIVDAGDDTAFGTNINFKIKK